MSTQTSSQSQSETLTEALSELLRTGRNKGFDPDKCRYVCHTSTIPLATTVDEQFVLDTSKLQDLTDVSHSIKFAPGYDPAVDYRCCLKHCMYVGKKGKTDKEILRGNCPCSQIVFDTLDAFGEEMELYLQPLCFLQVLKESRYDYGYTDASVCDTDDECCHNNGYSIKRSNRPKLDFSAVMFCQNSQSILDSRYSHPLREKVGFDGWLQANSPERIHSALDSLYWYRNFLSERAGKIMSRAVDKGFRRLKTSVEQALHTVNGMITKKFLLFPCEMEGYTQLARLTCELFEELIIDYLKEPTGSEKLPGDSVFMRMKTKCKAVKRNFASESIEHRLSCFDIILGDRSERCKFAKFFAPALKRLKKRVESMDSDYTTSLGWIHTMSGFSQTRNLGYLPSWIAKIKREEFRATIGREKTKVPREDLEWIRTVIRKRSFEMGIEPNFLNLGRSTRTITDDFKEVINSIKLPLKPTASIRSTVFQGGKVEDARQLLDDAMNGEWKVPVRNLSTGRIEEYLQLSLDNRIEKPPFEGYLFWISLQIILNYFGRSGKMNGYYKPFMYEIPGSESWEEELWKMSIVHISEPGKERNLTKTSPCVAWVLTIISKVSQAVLSLNQDHKAGLILSAQDWMHQKRVSSESYESDWMYDLQTRKRMPGVWNGFQDWKESTDYIPRQVGGAALAAWLDYIAFPKWFRNLGVLITQKDYSVSEYTGTNWHEGTAEREFYQGLVTEGFMMSMPLTKTVLHLMHDINIGTVHEILKRLGIRIAQAPMVPRMDPEKDVVGPFNLPDWLDSVQ